MYTHQEDTCVDTYAYDSERTNYFARGFSIENIQYDGIPTLSNSTYSSGQTLTDMAIYDRVDILKGAGRDPQPDPQKAHPRLQGQ